jgi:hypothetical protein
MRFSQLLLRRVLSSGIQHRAHRWNSHNVSEEHVASIFRVEEQANQETCVKQTACSFLQPLTWRRQVPPKRRLIFNWLHGVMSQKTELFTFHLCLHTPHGHFQKDSLQKNIGIAVAPTNATFPFPSHWFNHPNNRLRSNITVQRGGSAFYVVNATET